MKSLGQLTGFKHIKKCKVCSGKTSEGEDVRPFVESLKGQGKTNEQISRILFEKGVELTNQNLMSHFKKHAPYVEKGVPVSQATRKAVTVLTHSSETSKNVLNKIIGMSEVMIDNWWKQQHGEEFEGPTMPINQKMLISALQEDGKRAPKTALDQDFEKLTQAAIEGEMVDESNKPS